MTLTLLGFEVLLKDLLLRALEADASLQRVEGAAKYRICLTALRVGRFREWRRNVGGDAVAAAVRKVDVN